MTSTEINNDLIILVKDMAQVNARGDIGEPCFIISNHPNVQDMHQFRNAYAAELELAKSAISESGRVSKLPESIIAAKEKKTIETQRLKDRKSFELDLKTAAIAVETAER